MQTQSIAFSGEKDNPFLLILASVLIALLIWSVLISAVLLVGSSDYIARLSCRLMGFQEGKFVGLFQACFNPNTIDLRICAGGLCIDRYFVQ